MNISNLKNRFDGDKLAILALGPSLGNFNPDLYHDATIMGCNEFYRTGVKIDLDIFAMVNLVDNIVSIEKKNDYDIGIFAAPTQTAAMLEQKLGEDKYCWAWRDRELQQYLIVDEKTYSEGASVGIHMIALGLMMGFDEIDVFGIDMTPTQSSHFGFDKGGTAYVANVFGKYWNKMVADMEHLAEYAKQKEKRINYYGENPVFKEIFQCLMYVG
jgi:hypothetical protein